MNKEQILARLAEIKSLLDGMSASENGYTEEQITEIEALNEEFEGLDKQLVALEKVEEMNAKLGESTRKVAASAPTKTTPRVQVGVSHDQRFGGFDSNGSFLKAVRNAARGDYHKVFQSTAYEKNGEDGGFLVPQQMVEEIMVKLRGDDSLLAGTRQFNVSGNNLSIKVDENQPWNGGVQAYWIAEGEAYTKSKPSFKEVDFKLHKLGAMVDVTDELLDDASALESYIGATAPDAIMHKINEAIISGDGVGKPSGLLDSPFTVEVAKQGGQAADSIVSQNLIDMWSAIMPQSRARGAWYINAGAESQLNSIKDGDGRFMYVNPGTVNNNTFGTLLGRPVIPMLSALPQLGDAGDIIFADLGAYFTCLKTGGIKQSASIHLKFDQDITAFKFTMRLDGKAPYTSPVTTQYGNHQISSFVKLAERA